MTGISRRSFLRFVGIDVGAGDDVTAVAVCRFDEFRRFQIEEICRVFAVPVSKIVGGGR